MRYDGKKSFFRISRCLFTVFCCFFTLFSTPVTNAISLSTIDDGGNKIEVRDWTLEDAPKLVPVLNNPKILDNIRDGIPFPYTVASAEWFINDCLSSPKDSVFQFAVVYNGTIVGNVGVTRQDNIHSRTAELGFYIGEEFWGKGIATHAVKMICSFVFENTNIIRIFAKVFSTNLGCCRVLEKSGFMCEGVLHSDAIKNGNVLDVKIYGLLK